MESNDWLCAADAKLVAGFDKAHVVEVPPYNEDVVEGGDAWCDNPLMVGVAEWLDVMLKLLCGYDKVFIKVDGGIVELLVLLVPIPSKLGGIPRFKRAL